MQASGRTAAARGDASPPHSRPYSVRCTLERHVEADSDHPTAAWPAARRAVSTRKGEQLT